PLVESMGRDALVCRERQGRLLLPKRAEVQHEIRDVRLQRRGEPRRRRHVADRLRSDGVDRRRRGKDRRAREESGELRTGSPRRRGLSGPAWLSSTTRWTSNPRRLISRWPAPRRTVVRSSQATRTEIAKAGPLNIPRHDEH